MVRAFARKNEQRGNHFSEKDEPGWLAVTPPNEVSPASLWGLDDENSFRRNQGEEGDSGNGLPTSTEKVSVAHEVIGSESLEDSETPGYGGEPDWWAQPDLLDHSYELTNSERGIETSEAIPVATTSSVFEEHYSPTDQDDDETTLIRTAPHEVMPDEPHAEVEPANQSEQLSEEVASHSENVRYPALVLDESAVLPSEVSFATVPLAREVKRPRVLDETTVLPNEASYATVQLNQEIKSRPRVLDESTVLPNEASYATVVLNQEKKSRPRVLDESTVLPDEASFATIPLYHSSAALSYSPGREFVTKCARGLQRSLPVLLLVAVCAAVIVFSLKYKSSLGIFDSAAEEQTSRNPSAAPPVRSSVRPESPAVPARPVEVSTTTKATVPTEKIQPAADTKVRVATEKVQPADPKVAVASQKPESDSPVSTQRITSNKSEPRQAIDRPQVTKRKTNSEKTASESVTKTKPAETRTAATAAVEEKQKSEAEAPTVSSGGGERPRRVKPPGDSQANGTSPPKPKVIDWP